MTEFATTIFHGGTALEIAQDVLAHQHIRASWPVQHIAPLARAYIELAASQPAPLVDLAGEHGRPMPNGVRESGPA